MYRLAVILTAGLSLAGCSSLSSFGGPPEPKPFTLQLESNPPGAEAKTSAGPGCVTPCSVEVTQTENLSVTFALAKYETQTIPVQVTQKPGNLFTSPTTTIDPNPVTAELQPAPTRRGRAKRAK